MSKPCRYCGSLEVPPTRAAYSDFCCKACELTLVPLASGLSRIERIRALQAEASSLAVEHVAALTASLQESAALASEVAEGGDIFKPGIRDLARRFADDAEARALTLQALNARAS